jgi:hypothetical protein
MVEKTCEVNRLLGTLKKYRDRLDGRIELLENEMKKLYRERGIVKTVGEGYYA